MPLRIRSPRGSRPGSTGAGARFRWTFFLCAILPLACAPAFETAGPVTAAEIPLLEARTAQDPAAVADLVRLGQGYLEMGRTFDALSLLERAHSLEPLRPSGVAQLGLAYEAAERPDRAREIYETYRRNGNSAALLAWIDGRLPGVRRQALILAAREAVAREELLAGSPPSVGHIAVFPFHVSGSEAVFEPLGRALAEFMVTDLSVTGRLTVLERTRVQLLLDELALAETDRVDPTTAARSGRMLGAENTVVGTVEASQERVAMEAAVVDVVGAALRGDPRSEQDALQELFAAQKRLALELHDALGIDLTPAERDRILEMRTRSLDALLAFGRGLAEEDRGNFTAAAGHFRTAVNLDPGFQEAGIRAGETEAATEASSPPPPEGVEPGVAEEVALEGGPAPGASEGFEGLEDLIPDPQVRDAVSEATGREGVGRASVLDIILRRP
jgi:TolB-like protein